MMRGSITSFSSLETRESMHAELHPAHSRLESHSGTWRRGGQGSVRRVPAAHKPDRWTVVELDRPGRGLVRRPFIPPDGQARWRS